jgi:hypothetical protein
LISTQIQIKTGKHHISELFAIAAMTLLLIHISDAYMSLTSNHGFLPMSIDKKPFGISMFGISTFGISSILLFSMTSAMEIRGKKKTTKLTSTLLILGGALIACTVLAKSAMDYEGLASISLLFLTLIVIGYVIMGSGILSAIQHRKHINKVV